MRNEDNAMFWAGHKIFSDGHVYKNGQLVHKAPSLMAAKRWAQEAQRKAKEERNARRDALIAKIWDEGK